jgi:hypothetical protein
MYYGTHRGGLKCMFANLAYLQLDDGVSNDEDWLTKSTLSTLGAYGHG